MKPGFATKEDGSILVQLDYQRKDAIEGIKGRKWDPYRRKWILPLSRETVIQLRGVPGMQIDAELQQLAPTDTLFQEDAIDAEATPIAPMPLSVKPYAHQVQGYNRALIAFGYKEEKDAH